MVGWKEGNVAPSRHVIDILPRKPGPKLEAVSSRLKATLIHPNKDSTPVGLRYSPDGRRIIAGDYPGGIVQLWDALTGRQLTRIETGYGYRGSSDYFFLTPDWKTVFVSRSKGKSTLIERNGKVLRRWQFDGDVRAWDVQTGQLRDTFKHNPPRNIVAMRLSADGFSFMTDDQLIDEQGERQGAASIWNVKTKQYRTLPKGLSSSNRFSPDNKSIALIEEGADGFTKSIRLFDVRQWTQKLSIAISEKFAGVAVTAFAPGGQKLVGYVRSYPARNNWRTWQDYLKVWDTASGSELLSFRADEENTGITSPVFSPVGTLMAAVNWKGERGKLYLFDMVRHKLVKTVALTSKRDKDERIVVREPAFSPDGCSVAVLTQVLPSAAQGRDPVIEEVAQPRIHFVDVATGVVRETLVAPQGFSTGACFSPDGKTLATGGAGRVLLWDLTSLGRSTDR